METIWEYYLVVGSQEIYMPEGAKILSVAPVKKFNSICLWVTGATEAPKTQKRHILVVGVGYPIELEKYSFVGTVVLDDEYVQHVFERVLP